MFILRRTDKSAVGYAYNEAQSNIFKKKKKKETKATYIIVDQKKNQRWKKNYGFWIINILCKL